MADPARTPVALAVVGAGLIGRRHVEHVIGEECARLAAIVDPSPDARSFAKSKDAPWYPDFADMIADRRPEGVIVATPNQRHVVDGLRCVEAGLPLLIEKPIADDVVEARRLVEAAETAGVPLMVGHHRRHNPLIREAKRAIEAGRLGRLASVHATCWFSKPDEYFDLEWRRRKGAGPVFLNLIHDVDLLRHLCGEIVSVQAMESNALRGNEVEETAVVLLKFASGVLGTVNVSDKIVAPWSWELTSGENPAYAHTQESCYLIGGTLGSLTVPYLDLWKHPTKPNWWEPIVAERIPVEREDPLALQIRNLCEVVRGAAAPVVSGREGLETLKVIAAIKAAAASGGAIDID